MPMRVQDFLAEVILVVAGHKYYGGNRATELNALAAALNADTATRDVTLQSPSSLATTPGYPSNSRFVNDVLLVVNRGKASGLNNTAMSNAISGALAQLLPPVNTTPPAVTGTATVGSTLTTTVGIWTYVPTTYTYQWRRSGADIAGATATTYVIVTADKGNQLSCYVTATNAAGSTSVASNSTVAIP